MSRFFATTLFPCSCVLLLLCCCIAGHSLVAKPRGVVDSEAYGKLTMAVSSRDFPSRPDENGILHAISESHVYNGGVCNGDNKSPHLAWQLKPSNNSFVKSFAVTIYNPSAPTGSGWWHWIVYNIPVDVNEIDTGASVFGEKEVVNGNRVVGLTGINDSGGFGYAGPCHFVDDRTRKYIVTVYGLRVDTLPVSGNMPNAILRMSILRHSIVKASFVSFY